METNEIVDEFVNHLKVIERSEATISNYVRTIENFSDFLGDKPFEEVNESDLINYLGNGNLSATTKRNYLDAIKHFFKWLKRVKKLDVDVDSVEYLYSQIKDSNKRVIPELTVEDMRNIILTAKSPRDKAILLMLYKTGLRAGELRQLDVSDINFDTGKVIVRRRKGGNSGFVFIDEECIKWLNFYLSLRTDTDNALFVTVEGNRMGKETLEKMVKKVIEKAGYKKITPHIFRHIFTTHLQLAGCHLEAIRILRGDSKGIGGMVSYYTHFTEEQVKDWYLKTIPKLYI